MAKSTSGFKPGASGNPNGRPKGAATRKVSSLRGIFNRLKKMDVEAIDTIQKSLTEGSQVDKDKVQTAKWVITTITQLHKACLSEEEGRAPKEPEDSPPEIEEGEVDRSSPANVFSISMPDKK
jgi:Family of unknown function (DUF5681)